MDTKVQGIDLRQKELREGKGSVLLDKMSKRWEKWEIEPYHFYNLEQ